MALHPLYLSKEVCPEHPWLRGDRYPVTGECVMCARPAVFMETYTKERRERTKAVRARRDAARLEGLAYYHGNVCGKHPGMLGKRDTVTGHCLGCCPRTKTPEEAARIRANRKAAQEAQQPYYLGSVCDEHPELLGARYTTTGNCVGCHTQRKKKAVKPVNDNPCRYYGPLCDRHPGEKGLRYKSNTLCVACVNERAKKYYERKKKERNRAEVERVIDAHRQQADER